MTVYRPAMVAGPIIFSSFFFSIFVVFCFVLLCFCFFLTFEFYVFFPHFSFY